MRRWRQSKATVEVEQVELVSLEKIERKIRTKNSENLERKYSAREKLERKREKE